MNEFPQRYVDMTRKHRLGRRLPATLGLLVTLAIAPTSVLAQQPVVGDVVRVRLLDRTDPLEGVFQGVEEGSLALALEKTQDAVTFPLASVMRMDVHRGLKSHVLLGSAIGLLAGGLAGAMIVGNDRGCTHELDARFCALGGAGIGGGVGLPVGALVGLIVRSDRWEVVPSDALRGTVLGRPRVRLGVSIPIGGDPNRRGGR